MIVQCNKLVCVACVARTDTLVYNIDNIVLCICIFMIYNEISYNKAQFLSSKIS